MASMGTAMVAIDLNAKDTLSPENRRIVERQFRLERLESAMRTLPDDQLKGWLDLHGYTLGENR